MHSAIRTIAGMLFLLAAIALGCGKPSPTVTLLAAASTTDAVEEIAANFSQETGIEVQVSTGASSALAQQILAGAPADLFLSANQKWAETVEAEALVQDITPLLTNRIVLIVPLGNPAEVHAPADLLGESVTRVALAGETVPAGIYAQQALENLDLYAGLNDAGKIARGHDVRATLSYVEQGEAEAGIVYATDARISDGVEVVYTFGIESHEPVIYPLVLLAAGEENAAARQLYDYLQTAEAAEVFARYGFEPLSSEPLPSQP